MTQTASPNPSYDVLLRTCVFGAARVGKSSWVQRWDDPTRKFSNFYDVTIGVEFVSKIITNSPATVFKHSQRSSSLSSSNNNKNHYASISSTAKLRYKIQVWDTAGEPKFESIVKSYIRGACCGFICFDVNSSPSEALEQQVPHYIQLFKDAGYDHTSDRIYLILVGLKADDKGDESRGKITKTGSRDDDESNDDRSPGTRQVTRQEAEDFASQNGFLCYCEVSAKADWNAAEPFQRLVDYVHHYGFPGASDSLPVPRPMPVPVMDDDSQGKTNSRKKWGYFLTFKQLFFIDEKKNKKVTNDYSSLPVQSKYEPL